MAGDRLFNFVGSRNFGEFLSLQVAPLFNRIALPFAATAILFFNGWLIGLLGKQEKAIRRAAVTAWVLAFPVAMVLLQGFEDSRVLPPVSSSVWGGLLLTMLLTFVGITASFPLGVALALGRRSDLPAIKWTCTLFIETVRGVPLITILFMAKFIVPFFWDRLSDNDLLTIRMMIGLTLFSAAYLAENVRGGLQIIQKGQLEAARALGLNGFLTMMFIVLPQALRAVIPAIVGQFISLFKDTSLVALVGLFELVGIVDIIVSGQTYYRPYQREAYIFIAILYFVISYAMSDVSRRLETTGAGSIRRM
ncbi:MAG: amino acid ABC transporter permease [Anaerolineae bacterium]|nr:amino acid ABC transporter permease [Anaerolineae bacterium]